MKSLLRLALGEPRRSPWGPPIPRGLSDQQRYEVPSDRSGGDCLRARALATVVEQEISKEDTAFLLTQQDEEHPVWELVSKK